MSGTSGTAKPDSALLTEFADGQPAGSITPKDVRDIIVSETRNIAAAKVLTRTLITTGPYTLSDLNNAGMLVVHASTGVTVNVPTGLTAPFDMVILQAGVGQVTIAAAAGATVHVWGGDTLNHTSSQYATVGLSSVEALGPDIYILKGDVA